MILTESDLHAYNRGELSPEATRQLESDPLAMQDAARLRAIGSALRAEQPIPVTGRAETLDRLRARSARGIGTPRWIWGVGAASVAGLILISIPPDPPAGFRITRAVYELPASAPRLRPESDFGASDRDKEVAEARRAPEEAPASGVASASSPAASKPIEPPRSVMSRARKTHGQPLVLQVPDVEAALAFAEAQVQAVGGTVVERPETSSTRSSLRIETKHPQELRERLLRVERPIAGTLPTEAKGQAKVREEQTRNGAADRGTPLNVPSLSRSSRPDSSSGRVQEQRESDRSTTQVAVTFVTPPAPVLEDAPSRPIRTWLRAGGLLILATSLLILLIYRLSRRR